MFSSFSFTKQQQQQSMSSVDVDSARIDSAPSSKRMKDNSVVASNSETMKQSTLSTPSETDMIDIIGHKLQYINTTSNTNSNSISDTKNDANVMLKSEEENEEVEEDLWSVQLDDLSIGSMLDNLPNSNDPSDDDDEFDKDIQNNNNNTNTTDDEAFPVSDVTIENSAQRGNETDPEEETVVEDMFVFQSIVNALQQQQQTTNAIDVPEENSTPSVDGVPSSTDDKMNQNRFLTRKRYWYLCIIVMMTSITFVSSFLFGTDENQTNINMKGEVLYMYNFYNNTRSSLSNVRQFMKCWNKCINTPTVQEDEEESQQHQPLPIPIPTPTTTLMDMTSTTNLRPFNDIYQHEKATLTKNILAQYTGMGYYDTPRNDNSLFVTLTKTNLGRYLWMDDEFSEPNTTIHRQSNMLLPVQWFIRLVTFIGMIPKLIKVLKSYLYFVRMIVECIIVIGLVSKCMNWAYSNSSDVKMKSEPTNDAGMVVNNKIKHKHDSTSTKVEHPNQCNENVLTLYKFATETKFQRNGRRCRRNPSSSSMGRKMDAHIKTFDKTCYTNLSIDDLMVIGNFFGISEIRNYHYKMDIINTIVTSYHEYLQTFSISDIRKILHMKEVAFDKHCKKSDLIQLIVETGF